MKVLRFIRFCCGNNRVPPQSNFQSRHFTPKVSVQNFLVQQGISYKLVANSYVVKECPFCIKPHNNQISNLYKLNIHKDSGAYFCFRCSAKGSWLNFRGRHLGLLSENGSQFSQGLSATSLYNGFQQETHHQRPSKANSVQLTETEFMVYQNYLYTDQYSDVLEYLIKQRGLNVQTLKKYKLGAGTENFQDEGEFQAVKVVYFPMFRLYTEKEMNKYLGDMADYIKSRFTSVEGEADKKMDPEIMETYERSMINSSMAAITKMKIRGAGKENKQFMRQYPAGGSRPGLFGLNLLTPTTKQIIITEGEYDAMAAYQATGIIALSLPQGATSFPDNVLPFLEKIEKIYLWMDNDQIGQLNCPKIATKLGDRRTFVVVNPNKKIKDANDMLRSEPSLMKTLLDEAKTIPSQNIVQFDSLQASVRNRLLHADKFVGIKSSEMKFFNKKVKGLRTGELTILSGGTGSGKTTLLSQLSLDFCKQGVSTLWGSFQIKNQVLVQTMLSQFSGLNLSKNIQQMDMYFAKFKELPMYYMTFFGTTDLEKVFATIEYSIERFQVTHVVIDTLQFLLSGQAIGVEKFDLQEKVMARLRYIATSLFVHISVVIHPKKTEDGEDLGLHSIFGTSKSVQQADNVWIIQNRDNFKIYEIKKNRFDGELGKVALGFDKSSKKFFQLSQSELEQLFKKTITVEEIVENREHPEVSIRVQQSEEVLNAVNKTSNESEFLRQKGRGPYAGGMNGRGHGSR